MPRFASFARGTASLLAGLAVVFVLAYAMLFLLGYRPVAVYSGSMVPTIGVGSLAVDRPVAASEIRKGDIVTFSDPYVPGRLVTHRILRVFHTSHGTAYWTKGDANPARDPWAIQLPAKVGRVAFDVPYVGYALVYARTREVRGALLLLGCAALLTSVLRRIWRSDPVAVGPTA
jgi:signal peptidase